MAVCWARNPPIDESAPIVNRYSIDEKTFGVRKARRHPAYVYSTNKNACLMHKLVEVEIHHYALVNMTDLARLKQPKMIARTVCGQTFFLRAERARACTVPLPDAVLCGRCHGELPTFRRDGGKSKAEKMAARVKLGCEVAGYPSILRSEMER